jgi:hypothetical protein
VKDGQGEVFDSYQIITAGTAKEYTFGDSLPSDDDLYVVDAYGRIVQFHLRAPNMEMIARLRIGGIPKPLSVNIQPRHPNHLG